MKQRSSIARATFAVLATGALLAVASACSSGDSPPEVEDPRPSDIVESLTSEVDARTTAHATRTSSGIIRIDIQNDRGALLFHAEYRTRGASQYLIEYTLYPALDSDAPAEPTSSSIEVPLERTPTLEDATTAAVVIHSQFESAVLGNYDSWGCDLLPGRYNWIASCGTKGACCDVHDACYRRYGCTSGSWTSAPWNRCQYLCNAPAVACFAGANPGPSQCCFRGNCGQPR